MLLYMRKELLDGGKSHTQDEWINRLRMAIGSWPVLDLYFAVMSALYDNREHSDVAQKTMVKNVREVLATRFPTKLHDDGYESQVC